MVLSWSAKKTKTQKKPKHTHTHTHAHTQTHTPTWKNMAQDKKQNEEEFSLAGTKSYQSIYYTPLFLGEKTFTSVSSVHLHDSIHYLLINQKSFFLRNCTYFGAPG